MKSFIQYLQEAGHDKAVRSGDPELMKKELAKRLARLQYYRDEEIRFNKMPGHKGASEANAKFAQAEALKPGIEDLTMPLEAQGIKTGVKLSQLPTEKPWDGDMDPDNFDGPDMDDQGSSKEIEAAQQQNQFSGNLQRPFPTPSEMTANFFAQGRKPSNIRLR
jgi:hypothetical protein